MSPQPPLVIGSVPLTLDAVERVARHAAPVILDPSARARVAAARAVVDRLVEERVPAYGITTGVGSQKDYAVDPAAIAAYNPRLITAHATCAPGETAPADVVRGALLIQLALYATGRSGIRPITVDSLLARLNANDLPGAKLGSSVGASDIVAMSQLAVPLIGRAGIGPGGAGPQPLDGLFAKEALSLMNSNALTLSQGALALADARRLLDAATLVAALTLEGFRGNPGAWSDTVHQARGQAGQIATGARLLAALADSALWQPGTSRFLQDPLSFRCVPQINGAAAAALDWAEGIWTQELAAICDNPMIDLPTGRVISHGNMETTLLAVALDALRLSFAKMIEAAGERIHKLQWPAFSGLPTGLAAEGGAVGGVQFLNLGHIGAAALGAVLQRAHPATLGFRGQVDDGVEDVAGNAPVAVGETVQLLRAAWTVVTAEAVCAAWAIHRRGLDPARLGAGVQPLYAHLLPALPIGREGTAIFDLAAVAERLEAYWGGGR